MDLAATNNQTFVWTVSLASWALLYDLTLARYRMQIRKTAESPTVVLDFDSVAGAAVGTAVYSATSKLLTLRAPASAAARVTRGQYVYDLQMTIPVPSVSDPFVKLFAGGMIDVGSGVTR